MEIYGQEQVFNGSSEDDRHDVGTLGSLEVVTAPEFGIRPNACR
jgi:hypothetical protein